MERRDRRVHLVALAALVLLGLGLRATGLGRRYFWYDEALILDPAALALSGPEYAARVWRGTTYNPGWPLVVWGFLRAFGDNLTVARAPSCLAGTLAIAAAYWSARSVRLDRTTALLATLFTALSWTQIDYSQQVLPYAAAPVLASVCLAFLGRIDRVGTLASHLALAATCALYVTIHNSFVLMLPVVGVWLLLNIVHPVGEEEEGIPPHGRPSAARRAALAATTLALIMVPTAVFVLAKRDEGYRAYLEPYYLATFRQGSSPSYLGRLDDWYKAQIAPSPSPARDVPYFVATRTLDWLAANLNPRFSGLHDGLWLAWAAPSLGLFAAGACALGRGKEGRAAARLALGGAAGLGLAAGLSLVKLYPYGGVRQLLPLAPFATLAAAVGARRLVGRFPAAGIALTAGVAAVALLSAPNYYRLNATLIDESGLDGMLRGNDIRTVVAGDSTWSPNVLRYLTRARPDVAVVEPTDPAFDELIRARQSFVIVSIGFPALDWDATGARWKVRESFRPGGFDLGGYSARVALYGPTRDAAQQASVFVVRPRPEAAPAPK